MNSEIKEKYINKLGKRFSGGDKNKFRDAIITDFEELGYKSETITKRGKFLKVSNLYVGNIKTAKHFVIVPYDTLPKVFWPVNNCYPHDGYENVRRAFVPVYLPMLTGYCVLMLIFFMARSYVSVELYRLLIFLGYFIIAALVIAITIGFPNRHNAVRNSASICAALEIAKNLKPDKRKEVMFIFSDGNRTRNTGNKLVQEYFEEHKRNVSLISLYCIGRGNEIEIACDRSTRKIRDDMVKRYKGPNGLKITGKNLESEGKDNTNLECFNRAMMISSGERHEGILQVENVNTGKDTNVNEEIVDTVIDFMTKYLNN